jgi:diguanylate cyclase (GGDEF)-like protein
VIDRSPRQLDDRQKQMLRDLGDIVMDQIELRRMVSIDPVTGAFSRRHILELAEREARRSRRYGFPMSIAMLDIDDFKSVNDRCGHAIGDAVLKALANCCHGTDREQDLFGRMGGDEFLMVMPHTDGTGAVELLERIRHTVEAGLLPLAGRKLTFTVSVGVCEIASGSESLEVAIERADRALYAAKKKGRNRVTLGRAA